MYLAQVVNSKGHTHFVIRESYKETDGTMRTRDLFDLGQDPEAYIRYVGPRGFYIDYEVEDAVRQKAASYTYDELEALFWPFLDPDIKATIRNFSHGPMRGGRRFRARSRRDRRKEKEALKARLEEGLHPFDRRRLLFLKFGQINIETMWEEPFPFLTWPLEKSRDEIEHTIWFMEMELRPWEMRGYLYTIFNIPERLKPRMSRFIPDVQELEVIDGFFLEELCRLNQDESYLDPGANPQKFQGVHPYLRKYLIYYFDTFYYSEGSGYIGGRFRREGTYHPGVSANAQEGEYLAVFGISKEEFSQMDEKALTRLFRKKALKLHPDKGGDHERFIRLKDAYKHLLRRKAW